MYVSCPVHREGLGAGRQGHERSIGELRSLLAEFPDATIEIDSFEELSDVLDKNAAPKDQRKAG